MRLWEELHVGMISVWMGKGDIPQRAYWEPQAPFLPKFLRENIPYRVYWAWVFLGAVSHRHHFSLGLWEEFPLGPILAWICTRNII